MPNNIKLAKWVLRVAVAGEFIGHGIFAIKGEEVWIEWITMLTSFDAETAAKLLLLIGFLDLFVGIVTLVKPIRLVLLWAAFWGFWTAVLGPIVGEPIGEFIEESANWGAPLALLLLVGWPKNRRELME